ncbi:sugar phosphate isomerase/epimerase [Gorillibacterium sp. CAU 1737]|uniref:sugar phosphate isomerase/epimerase family protein n=1 Tax=Gorillibacterium sp. CAU 1737 TaxID=3140362 RepID=UPI0032619147
MALLPIGLQLYTLRDYTETDMAGTLRRVAALGFEMVEFAGYGGLSASELNAVLKETGLVPLSAHVPYDQLKQGLDEQIRYAKEIGLGYLIFPYVDPELLKTEEGVASLVRDLTEMGHKIKEAGLDFCYHNHDAELGTVGGELILDRIYRLVEPELLQAELDLYWVKKAGLDPYHYLLSYPGHVPIVHLKDMTDDEEGFFAEVGHGSMDFPALLGAASEAGVRYLLVEQDQCRRSPWESIEMSLNYLRSIGAAKPLT